MNTDNTNLEAAYLGTILTATPNTQTQLLPLVHATDFTDPRNTTLWTTMNTMHHAGAPIDTLTLTAWCHDHGTLPPNTRRHIGSTLTLIASTAPPVTTGPYYAQLLRDHTARRLIQTTGQRLTNTWAAPDLQELHDDITRQLQACTAAIEHAHNPANTPAQEHTTT